VSAEPEILPHDRLIGELRSLCAAGRSGTMFIITAENHAAQFVLRNGAVVHLTYRLLRGLDALPSLKRFPAGRYRFQDESTSQADPALPPTPELLATLLGGSSDVTPSTQARPTQAHPAAAAPIPDALRPLIARELAEFLGPMASLICDEYFAQVTDPDSPTSRERLIEALAREIRDPAKEADFKRRALPILQADTSPTL
jgi:hypothetical protein